MPAHLDAAAMEGVLRRYDILPPAQDGKSVRALEGDHTIVLGGYMRDDGQKMITLTAGNVSESRPCPVDAYEAQRVVEHLWERRQLPRNTAMRRMLQHLLTSASAMYVHEPIEAFLFDAIRVGQGDYQIGAASILAN